MAGRKFNLLKLKCILKLLDEGLTTPVIANRVGYHTEYVRKIKTKRFEIIKSLTDEEKTIVFGAGSQG